MSPVTYSSLSSCWHPDLAYTPVAPAAGTENNRSCDQRPPVAGT